MKRIIYVDSTFFNIILIILLWQSGECLKEPYSIVLDKVVAVKLFGSADRQENHYHRKRLW